MVNRKYRTRVNINLTVTQNKIQNEDSVVPRTLCTRDIRKLWESRVHTSDTISDVLLTVHLFIFTSQFKQLDAQNLFHNKFYLMPLHVSSTCARNM